MPPIETGFAEIALVSTPISRTRRTLGEILFLMLTGRVPGQAYTAARPPENKHLRVGKVSRVLAAGRAEASTTSYDVFGMNRGMDALRTPLSRQPGGQQAGCQPCVAGCHSRTRQFAMDLTGSSQSASLLIETAERLTLALEASRLGTWDQDLCTGLRIWSDRTCTMWGLPPGAPALSSAEALALIRPADRLRVSQAYEAALRDGIVYDCTFTIDTPNDGTRVLHSRGQILRNAAGRPSRAVGVIADVTERFIVEAALAERADALRLAIEGGQLGTWSYDFATGRRVWSDRTKAFHGLVPTDPEPDADAYAGMIAFADRTRIEAAMRAAERDGKPYECELTVLGRDDVTRMLAVHGNIEHDPATGARLRAIGVMRDVTAQRATEVRLREQDARVRQDLETLSAIYSSAPVGLCVLDRDLRFLRVNEHLARMNGLSAEESLGRTVHDVVPQHAALVQSLAERTFAGFPVSAVELVDPDTSRSFHASHLPLHDAAGAVIGVNVVVQETTAQRAAETALHHLNEELEARVAVEIASREMLQAGLAQAERMQALGQLASGIAHDVNNVLQAVQAALGIIRANPDDAARVAHFAAMADAASERGASITARLLAFSRPDKLQAGPVEPSGLFASLAEVLRPTLGGRAQLMIDVGPDLPAVFADRAQLETVLVNLAANARDAIMDTGWPGTIRLAAALDGDLLRIDVIDDGAGMAKATLARASEPFFTTKAPGRGTGLGLPMAYGFAKTSNGRMVINSRLGMGTTISLWLPITPQTQDELAQFELPHIMPASIFVVDDDETVREVLADQLRDQGHQVEACESGAATLALLDAGVAADLLITDLNMPDQDGTALIHATRLRRPGLPFLLLTGDPDDLLSAPPPGLVLRKPIRTQVLAKAIAELLQPAPPSQGVQC